MRSRVRIMRKGHKRTQRFCTISILPQPLGELVSREETLRVREITIWTKITIYSTVEKVILFVAAECKRKFMVLVKIKTKESNIYNLFVCLTLHSPPHNL
jgi:hypothetical protein